MALVAGVMHSRSAEPRCLWMVPPNSFSPQSTRHKRELIIGPISRNTRILSSTSSPLLCPMPQSSHTSPSSDDEDGVVNISAPSSHANLFTMDKGSIEMVDHPDVKIKRESSEVDVQGMVDETVRRIREQSDR